MYRPILGQKPIILKMKKIPFSKNKIRAVARISKPIISSNKKDIANPRNKEHLKTNLQEQNENLEEEIIEEYSEDPFASKEEEETIWSITEPIYRGKSPIPESRQKKTKQPSLEKEFSKNSYTRNSNEVLPEPIRAIFEELNEGVKEPVWARQEVITSTPKKKSTQAPISIYTTLSTPIYRGKSPILESRQEELEKNYQTPLSTNTEKEILFPSLCGKEISEEDIYNVRKSFNNAKKMETPTPDFKGATNELDQQSNRNLQIN